MIEHFLFNPSFREEQLTLVLWFVNRLHAEITADFFFTSTKINGFNLN